MSDRTESLLRDLACDLAPVRPIPPLRAPALLAVGALAVGVSVQVMAGGRAPGFAPGVAWSDAAHLVLFVGLGLAGLGCLSAALAGAVPGRERLARAGRMLAWFAAGLVAAGSVAWIRASGAPESGLPISSSLGCAGRAALLGIVPGVILGLFLGRALPRRPWILAIWAAVAALALGALVVHASCANGGALHVPLGHGVVPGLLALALALPLGVLARGGVRVA